MEGIRPRYRKVFGGNIVVFLLLLILLSGAVFSLSLLRQLKFSYDIEAFFSEKDSEVQYYYSFRKHFGNENDYLQIGLENSAGIFQLDFLWKVDSLTQYLQADTNVRKVISPTSASRKIKTPFFGYTAIPLIHHNDPGQYEQDKKRIRSVEDPLSGLFSEDQTSVRIILSMRNGITQEQGASLLEGYESEIRNLGFDASHFAGRIATQRYYVREMRSEFVFFSVLAVTVIVLALFVVLGSVRYSILTLIVIVLSLIISFGLIAAAGTTINLMLVLMPAIVLIVGASSSIHFFSDLSGNLTGQESKPVAVKKSLKTTGIPLLLNALTTAIGFASLIFIPVPVIQEFGLFTGIAVFISFANLILIGIASSVLLPAPKKELTPIWSLPRWNLFSPKGYVVYAAFVPIVLGGLVAFRGIDVSNHFLEDLKDKSALKQDLKFFERHFDGIRPFELVVKSKSGQKIGDRQFLKELELLENEVKKVYGVHQVISPLSILRSLNQSIHSGRPDMYTLPDSERDLKKVFKELSKIRSMGMNGTMESNLGFRFSARLPDLGSREIALYNRKIERYIAAHLPDLEVHFTGAAYLMDRTNSQLAVNLIKGLLLAVSVAVLMILLITRSVRIALLSIIPNVIPLLFVLSMIWIFGISINIGTAMIFPIVFGIAVDDTLHFVFRYHQLSQQHKRKQAVDLTVQSLQKAMTGSSIILGTGFLIFGFSGFTSISVMGIIVGLSLFVALLADLYLLPRLILMTGSDS